MTELLPRQDSAASCLRERAVRILALRDHSEQQLRRKLATPVWNKNDLKSVPVTPEEIDNIIHWCFANHYLDDERFARQFIVSRSRKGYGPVRIRQELQQKGVDNNIVDIAIRACDIDWIALAKEQIQRKYGQTLPTMFSEKVKIQRFLLYRGFVMENIQDIWRNFVD
ncbi:regulatory protein RecX [Enterobacteriaceae bacterium ESL0689]|nr:regulatory protein RecX [Enterobacteriaceae bacterium ESL0689]